jgi:transmembrane sensor
LPGHTDIPQRRADLTDEAAGWLAALDAGSADMAAFEAWRDADIRHAVAFAEVAGAWRDMDRLRVAHGEIRHETSPLPAHPAPVATARPDRRRVLRAAAAFAAVAAVGGGGAYRAYARDMAVTAVGQRKAVAAMPGLSLDLNTDSRVFWRDGAPARLWLDRGEVAIALAGNRHLELATPGGRFRLEPGRYNARLRGAACELAVLVGGIADGMALRMGAGDVALVTGGQVSMQARDAGALGRVTAWRHDTLVLNGESLDYAVAELNRYLPDKIVIGDPALSRLRLGGTFATTDPAEFLHALRTSFSVRTTAGTNGVVLTRA